MPEQFAVDNIFALFAINIRIKKLICPDIFRHNISIMSILAISAVEISEQKLPDQLISN